MFGKPRFPLSVDIGSHAIKLVQFEHKKKKLALKRLGMASLAPGAVAEGVIRDPEEVMRAFEELVAAEKAKEREVVVALSGSAAVVRPVRVPSDPSLPVEEAIEAEAAQILPFPVEEARLTHSRMGRVEAGGQRMEEFLLVAVRRKPLADLVELFRHLEYEPKVVDVALLALESAIELAEVEEGEGCLALVDIGAGQTLVHILRSGRTLLTRVIPRGGAAVTAALAKRLNVSSADAEAMKLGAKPVPSPRAAAEAVRGEAERLGLELGRTFQLLGEMAPGERVTRLVLCGGGVHLDGLPAFLATSLDIPAEILQPFRHVQVAGEVFDLNYVETLGPVAAVAAGLAYRAMESGES
ncbi:MAG: type IV pilus assembly protein PilM [Candidatus Tectomicrobia bacterium]|uniref:Type IV pilus assembly protein PilM n=1 Tax=Tectimicrobiota bacterium TaxID=2528274 RepID=A0A932I307_UNCTE|nr:type IV pilus assembly protein PilM [Candidatus Tectomicrobia bacterium]